MALGVALTALTAGAQAQGTTGHHLYMVPGIHYGTPARTSFSLTAFLDGRGSTIGKGHLLILEGGRDAMKGQIGLADVSHSMLGWSTQVGFLRTGLQPMDGLPHASYAGSELHLYIGVVNLGTGFYAPVGTPAGRRGVLHLSAGLGF
jgi:hypothetical protein